MSDLKTGPRPRVVIEDVEFLTLHGGTWESIAARLGVTPGAVHRALLRAGEHDLIGVLAARRNPTRAGAA